MDNPKTYQKNPSVVCTELDDGAILLNLDTKYYYNLNETGLRIWQILDEVGTPLQIAKKLASEYEMHVEGVRTSVVRLISQLESEGLVIQKDCVD
jgi:hypothetical protein